MAHVPQPTGNKAALIVSANLLPPLLLLVVGNDLKGKARPPEDDANVILQSQVWVDTCWN